MKVKLSTKSLMFLGIGILVVAFAGLGVAHSQQVDERNQLDEELALAEQRLDALQLEPLQSQQEGLERQLSQTLSQLQSDLPKTILSQPLESIDTTDTLFSIAETCNVDITGISSSKPGSGDLEGLACFTLPVTVTAEGDIIDLIDFVVELNDGFRAGAVKSVRINVPEVEEEEEDTGKLVIDLSNFTGSIGSWGTSDEGTTVEEKKPSADVQLIIYCYEGDQP